MTKEYAIDVNKLLVLNADYNQQIFIVVSQNSDGEIKPQLEYRGRNKRIGETIKTNVSELISLKKTETGIEVFLGNERFAGFCLQDGQYVVDEKVPQEHLTAFEMRELGRSKLQPGIPFSRNISKKLAPVTDLHNHFAGAPSPEGLIEIGLKHNLVVPKSIVEKLGIKTDALVLDDAKTGYYFSSLCQDEESKAKLAESMRIPREEQETFFKMEDVYTVRDIFTKNPKLFPDVLMLIGQELAAQGVKYTELSLAAIIRNERATLSENLETLKTITEVVPKVEKQTGCKIRFLAALYRRLAREQSRDKADVIKAVATNPYVVGMDVMGHEANSTQEFGPDIKEVALWAMEHDPDFCIRVHAGENPLFKDNVKDTLKIMLQARSEYASKSGIDEKKVKLPQIRIGHGLYGVDDETLALCKETGAIIEFNMSSNLSLNNIDSIRDVPIVQYVKKGIPFVLGTDGAGIYSTSAIQEVLLAGAAGVTEADLKKMRKVEEDIMAREAAAFKRKNLAMQAQLKTTSFEEIFKPVYSTPTGKPRYNKEVEQKYQKEEEDLIKFLHSELSRCHIETDPKKVEAAMADKVPVLVTGASVKAWPDISEKDQEEIRRTMALLVRVLDPEKAYVLTGGTNHGVEKELHIAAHQRNEKSDKPLAVIGTLTKDAAYTDRASIEADTITHATVLKMDNGQPAQSWFDLPDTVLSHVQAKNGEMIAVGGGGVVRDMIQRAHNMGMNINLMDGPTGASTDKAKVMPEYKFVGAEQLIKHLYSRHPDIFVPGFDINKLQEYGTNHQNVSEGEDVANSKQKPSSLKGLLGRHSLDGPAAARRGGNPHGS